MQEVDDVRKALERCHDEEAMMMLMMRELSNDYQMPYNYQMCGSRMDNIACDNLLIYVNPNLLDPLLIFNV